jgi:aminoglycoside phosphotransferase (APT) family kinase protein
MMLRVGLRFGLQKTSLTVSNTDPFAAFLCAASRVEPGEPFSFAVLTGNSSAPGRRHVFLLFNSASEPVAVVKAGATSRARELIAHETSLLSAFASALTGLPKVRGACELDNLSAFAMDFIEGTSPGDDAGGELETIFSSWVDSARQIEIGETVAWKRLIQASGAAALPEAVLKLETLRTHPVLMHGDFAPWNVKVSAGRWTVLDWERGERVGIPAWDWFHFVVQPAVLVRRETTEATLARLEKLFPSAEFQRYAARCGIIGAEWMLAFAYVEYCVNVTRQTEGLKLLEALREAIHARWTTAR